MRWLSLLALCALTGCARHYTADSVADPYGFWSGIWHGFVCPYAICANVVSWGLSVLGIEFMQSIEIVGRPNTGFGYYFGFFCGLCPLAGSGANRR